VNRSTRQQPLLQRPWRCCCFLQAGSTRSTSIHSSYLLETPLHGLAAPCCSHSPAAHTWYLQPPDLLKPAVKPLFAPLTSWRPSSIAVLLPAAPIISQHTLGTSNHQSPGNLQSTSFNSSYLLGSLLRCLAAPCCSHSPAAHTSNLQPPNPLKPAVNFASLLLPPGDPPLFPCCSLLLP
jgi:hypothetical protein